MQDDSIKISEAIARLASAVALSEDDLARIAHYAQRAYARRPRRKVISITREPFECDSEPSVYNPVFLASVFDREPIN